MGVAVTRDEVDKRQFDGLALRNQNPNKVYRWGRKDDYQISMHRFHGYEIVDRKEDPVESILNSGTRMKKAEDVDSTIQLGDLVLMSIDKDKYEARRREEEDFARRRQLATKRSFHNDVRALTGQHGISFEESDERRGYTGSMDENEHDKIVRETEELDRRSRARPERRA